MRLPSCFDYILHTGFRLPKPYVVSNGIFKKIHVLKYHTDVGKHLTARHIPYIYISNSNASPPAVIKSWDKFHDCAFSTARPAHERRS